MAHRSFYPQAANLRSLTNWHPDFLEHPEPSCKSYFIAFSPFFNIERMGQLLRKQRVSTATEPWRRRPRSAPPPWCRSHGLRGLSLCPAERVWAVRGRGSIGAGCLARRCRGYGWMGKMMEDGTNIKMNYFWMQNWTLDDFMGRATNLRIFIYDLGLSGNLRHNHPIYGNFSGAEWWAPFAGANPLHCWFDSESSF